MNKVIRYNLLFAAALLLFVGCLGDSFDDCPRPLRVTIRAFDVDQRDITSLEYVQSAYLFVFDQNEQFLFARQLNAAQFAGRSYVGINFDNNPYVPGSLDHSFHIDDAPQSFIFDVWANVCDLVDFTHRSAIPMNQRDDKRLTLNRAAVQQAAVTLSANRDVALSPGDLFHGSFSVPVQFGDATLGVSSHVVNISRKTAQVHIITTGLREFNNNQAGTYHYEVHGGVDAIDHTGAFAGDLVRKTPAATFNAQGEFVTTEAFRKLATQHNSPAHQGETIAVDIFFNNTLLYSANEDSDGNPFVAYLGRTLNIVIELDPDGERVISIRTIVTPWDEVHQEANIGGGSPRPPCPECGERPCVCPPVVCDVCDEYPCVCPPVTVPCDDCGEYPCVCPPVDVCDVCDEYPCVCVPGNVVDPDSYVLIAGTRWATRNVAVAGQFAPVNDRGMMFQWGNNTAWVPGADLVSHPAGATWQTNAQLSGVNNDWYGGVGPCPTGWRLPTLTEFGALLESGAYPDYGAGVFAAGGVTFGVAPNQVFFPRTGRRNAAGWGMEYMGFYFAQPVGTLTHPTAGTPADTAPGRMNRMHFGAGVHQTNAMDRVHGQFVRCVRI